MENNFFFSPALEQAIEQVIIECPTYNAEDIKQKLANLKLFTTGCVKDYYERINTYQIFVNDLLKRLVEEKEIKMSRQKYYSLTADIKTKGYDGHQKAFKYIFNKYIVDTFEYNTMPENTKRGYKTIDEIYLIDWVVQKIIKYI